MRSPIALLALARGRAAASPSAAAGQGFLGGERGRGAALRRHRRLGRARRRAGVYVARGNVRITQPERVLSADWVGFSSATRQGLASGNVVMIEGDDVLRADVLQFQIDSAKGVVFDGKLEGGGTRFLMSGDTIQKTGENTYVFDEGQFTSCKCPEDGREPWAITADKAEPRHRRLRHRAQHRVRGARGPGRLAALDDLPAEEGPRDAASCFPVWNASSRRGFDIGLPFFWAVGERLNLTFTASYLTENGFMPCVDGEYVFGEKSSGRFYGAWIDDKNIDPDDPSTPFSSQRWALELIHDQYLPYDFRLVVDARFFSDNLYAVRLREVLGLPQGPLHRVAGLPREALRPAGPLRLLRRASSTPRTSRTPTTRTATSSCSSACRSSTRRASPRRLDKVVPGLVGSFDVDYTHFWAQDRPDGRLRRRAATSTTCFVDTGIDAIPDGARAQQRRRRRPARRHGRARGRHDVSLEEFVALNPRRRSPERRHRHDARRAFTAGDFVALSDGSLDNFPPGPEGDGDLPGGRAPLRPRASHHHEPPALLPAPPLGRGRGEPGDRATTARSTRPTNSFYEDRNLFSAQLDVRTRLRRALSLPFGMGDALHVLAPHFNWTAITDESQDGQPALHAADRPPPAPAPPPRAHEPDARLGGPHRLRERVHGRPQQPLLRAARGGRGHAALRRRRLRAPVRHRERRLHGRLPRRHLPGRAARIRTKFNVGYDFNAGELDEAMLAVSWSHEEGHDVGMATATSRKPRSSSRRSRSTTSASRTSSRA